MSYNKPVLSVKNISKCFYMYDRPVDRLKSLIQPKNKSIPFLNNKTFHKEFWALKDVSFEVGSGECVGIIGQNGSGKSTLLQIITGTMSPSCGTVDVDGKITALLELGSGFNPDFTGRENVFLNGALIGMTREEVEAKFDWIASFADIGPHLDQPVKTYSSGMMLRLAFAVQAAVDVQLLIVDEALAVGDARFQLKCFKRLEELKSNGTTILFVSHSTELIRSLCDRALLLEKGMSLFYGDTKIATTKYYDILFPNNTVNEIEVPHTPNSSIDSKNDEVGKVNETRSDSYCLNVNRSDLKGDSFGVGGAKLISAKFKGLEKPNILIGGKTLHIELDYSWDPTVISELLSKESYKNNIGPSVALCDNQGRYIFGCNGFDKNLNMNMNEEGRNTVEFELNIPQLSPGSYFMTIAFPLGDLKHHVQLVWYDCAIQFEVLHSDTNVFGVIALEYTIKESKRK